ncbi:hypothetical protein ILUMI_15404 [Ignelater luminosus]|uniref:NADP-dependent oxidoreductase domain-containing protein n=1 Tax=Ignelater luminosus TaxID=2038154 RepID=A0A8K0CNN3_IGNLU|nr:hypothetical protein ILUMI_15404 [Ignelater luminosus]
MVWHTVPIVQFYNKLKIPMIGLGTWKITPEQVRKVIKTAIDLGYRHFDCAVIYGNEAEIGEAIKDSIDKKRVAREDLFITGKLWNTFHRHELVEECITKSLYNLKIDYFDLYLMHWPMAYKEGSDLMPRYGNRILYSLVHYVDTWQAMQELVDKCLTKSIGVANFSIRQLQLLLRGASIKPVLNQIECHPYLNQESLVSFCKSNGIAVTCYSPLGSPDRPWVKMGEPILLQDPKLKEVGEFYFKTPAQVALRYQVQRGNIVIPKSVTPARLKHNLEIFDFKLSCEHMEEIDSMDRGKRYLTLKSVSDHPFYPFCEKEY